MTSTTRTWLIAAALSLPCITTAAEPIDEIVVSADFRERNLSEVPFSVSVLGAEFINDTAVQHFEELVQLVPNMNWSGDGHRARYFQIRGVGELEQYQGAPNPSIGFLIDDIDFSGIGTIATVFDIESIEVLRGPQGSRYGANALGGLIYVRSAAPSVERQGRFQISAGSDNAVSLGAAFGGALNDAETTTFRLSAHQHESNGFRDNPFLNRDDTNGRDELSIRAAVQMEPSERLSARVAFIYSKIDDGYDAFALDNSYTVLSDQPGQDAQESLGSSLRLNWALRNEMSFTSITSLAQSDIDFSFDADWGNTQSWAPFTYDFVSLNDRSRDTLSQELRFGNDEWLVGLYVLNLSDELATVNLGDYFDPFFNFADTLDARFDSDYEATSVALFGQRDFALGDATELAAGLRVERRSTDYQDSASLQTGPSDTMWGGELSLTHQVREHTRLYASLSKGYKAGGFNLGATPPGQRDFGAEEMWTIEVGTKSVLLENRLQLNAALFHNQRRDQQVRTATQLVVGDPASFVFFTDNIGKGDGLGLEADFRYFADEYWEIYGSLGLLDATLENGRQQAHAPRFTWAAGVSYRNPNGFFARLDASAKDEFYFDVSHDQKSNSFELLNARLGIETESWLISLWARNLLDRDYAVRGFFFGNEPPNFPNTLYTRLGDPRQYGITIEMRY